MKTERERLKLRMNKDRPHSALTISIPDDVIDELREIAPTLGFTNYVALARTYIGEGLRRDLERLDQSPLMRLTESLRRQGLSDEVIAGILEESELKVA